MPSQRSTPLHTEAAGAAPFDSFGPFRVLHQIGAGTLGPVFRAYDPDQDRLVAVKLFQLGLTPDKTQILVDGLQRLVEADLGHPGFAAPIAAGRVANAAFLAQDFVAADALDVVLREFGPLAPGDVVRHLTQMAAALDAAAAAGILHGALHPRDLLLAVDDGRLTGVGVVQVLDAIGWPTPMRRPYTAPERLAGATWDRRADVFSLGALVVDMLTARRMTGAGVGVLESMPELAGTEREPLRDVLAQALADEPGDRFETAGAFAEALAAVLARAGSERLPDRIPERLPERVPTDLADVLIAPRLPLDEPLPIGIEARLPGDAPLVGGDPAPPEDWDLHAPPAVAADPNRSVESAEAPPVSPEGTPAPVTSEAPAPMAPSPADRSPRPPAAARVPFDSGRDVTQSALWPLALALMVGLIIGVAIGFFIFTDRSNRGTLSVAADPRGQTGPGEPAGSAGPGGPGAVGQGGATVTGGAATPGAPPATSTAQTSVAQAPVTEDAPSAAAATPATTATTATAGRAAPHPLSTSPRTATSDSASRDTDRRPVDRSAPSTRSTASGAPESGGRQAAGATGRLLVRSSPAGARVSLDGQDVGATPLTLRELPFGTHTLRVSREGYESESRRVIISGAQPAPSLVLDLARARNPGDAAATAGRTTAALAVESRPAGASVFLDGRRVGVTPLMLDPAPSGSHALRIELDGYRRWTAAVRVVAGERNRVTASLEQD